MDIRDLKDSTIIPDTLDGSGLRKMYDLQKGLLDHYIKIEGMMAYPLDIDLRDSQIMMKDFIGRTIEELAEANESYRNMLEIISSPDYDEKELIQHLYNYNEEIADAMHFFLEVLIYCNISEDDIKMYYNTLLDDKNLLGMELGDNVLGTALQYGDWCNLQEGIAARNFRKKPSSMSKDMEKLIIELVKKEEGEEGIGHIYYESLFKEANPPYKKILSEDQADRNEFIRGGSTVSVELLAEHNRQLWEITYWLNISRNFLKNKPWKQSEMSTDQNRFQEAVMEGWLALFKYLSFSGHTDLSLFTTYFLKNKINQFRIESLY